MRRLSSLVTGILFASCLALGQFETSEVLGIVRDASQSAIANATVVLTNQETGIEAKTTTDEAGNYDFFNVKVGVYTVTVEATGFSKAATTDMRSTSTHASAWMSGCKSAR